VLPVKFAAKGPAAYPRQPPAVPGRKPFPSPRLSLSLARYFNFFFLIFHKQRTHFVPYSSSLLLLLPPSPPVSFHDASGCFSPSAITPANGIRCMKFAYATIRPRARRVADSASEAALRKCHRNAHAKAIITYFALYSTLSLSGTLCISVLVFLTFVSRYCYSCSVIIVYEYFALVVRAMSVRLVSIGLSLIDNNRSLNLVSVCFLHVVHCLHRRSRVCRIAGSCAK